MTSVLRTGLVLFQARRNFLRLACASILTSRPRKSRWVAISLCLLAASGTVLTVSAASATSNIEYNRDVRPILSENCFSCHGPDSASRKAGLRLDRFEEAILPRKDSQPAI